MGPKPANTSSKFYKPDQRCAYPSNNIGHDSEDCINLKYKIQYLIDQEVVSLQMVSPNINTNPLSNNGGININMIEMNDYWSVTKVITHNIHDELESDVLPQ